MTDPHCPYCYRPVPSSPMTFRCSGRPGPNGRRCETRIDSLLAAHTGDTEPRYPAFTVRSGRRNPVCPICGEVTFQRLCGSCHSQLPAQFGDARTHLIALVGAKESGKSVYMTVLLHELHHRVGKQFGLAVMGADEYTKNTFRAEYENFLYDDGRLIGATRPATAQGVSRPFVFSVALERRRWFGRPQLDRSLFSFFDTAGEDLRSAESVERNVRYLVAADGILLMLDPLQMRGARPLAETGTLLPQQPAPEDHPDSVLGRITELLQSALRTGRRGRIRKPIALVFSKMDALFGTLPEENVLLRDAPHDRPVFDEADSRAVDHEVRQLLDRWHSGGMIANLDKNFARYRFFSVSALGGSPVADDGAHRVSEYGVQPRRVPDPFLWLLSEFGTIPKTEP